MPSAAVAVETYHSPSPLQKAKLRQMVATEPSNGGERNNFQQHAKQQLSSETILGLEESTQPQRPAKPIPSQRPLSDRINR
jgi:hypothetical protein